MAKRKSPCKWLRDADGTVIRDADGRPSCEHGPAVKSNSTSWGCREAQFAWRKANPEKHREGKRAWQRRSIQADPEKHRAWERRWRDANPDKVRANNARWRDANPDKVRANNARSNACRIWVGSVYAGTENSFPVPREVVQQFALQLITQHRQDNRRKKVDALAEESGPSIAKVGASC
jgi:hypothetical protein